MKTSLLSLAFAFTFGLLQAADLLVPSQYASIQSAINAASNGDVIIVDNGTYFENIDFTGKSITVTSNFHNSGDPNDILTTIIDGSQSTDLDKGSCVSFIDDENEDAILKGFTITGGTGTKTYNPSDDAFFRTGGGIIINEASPTITNNIITNNVCIAEQGVTGAGGGGIRMGFGQPIIRNNIIDGNLGGYAGGIMIAYCGGAVLKNNIISNNTATGSFNGGGGVYVDWEAVVLENNTIVDNHSDDKGGGMIATGTSPIVLNSIIYGNTAANGSDQIFKRFGGNATLTYTAIEDGFDGTGNEEGVISDNPNFNSNTSYTLLSSSPCIDTGNPAASYNDIEDPMAPGSALYPSLGGLRNDMGAYGGQGSETILSVLDIAFSEEIINLTYENPYKNAGIHITAAMATEVQISVYTLGGKMTQNTTSYALSEGLQIIPLAIRSTSIVVFRTETGQTHAIKLIKL